MTVSTILLIVALILFILAALPKVSIGSVNLVPAGLACVVLAVLLGSGAL
ncbi:hypothetical protein [Sphingomonas sp. URHD0057]|nr:hypothetical protein [Sphingomonas sp. URHD0057]